jgi:hypothetical protein
MASTARLAHLRAALIVSGVCVLGAGLVLVARKLLPARAVLLADAFTVAEFGLPAFIVGAAEVDARAAPSRTRATRTELVTSGAGCAREIS